MNDVTTELQDVALLFGFRVPPKALQRFRLPSAVTTLVLVGAFLVGIVASRLRERLPRLESDKNVHAVEVFASFFIPFYFFNAGVSVPPEALTWASVALGLLLAFFCIPVRVALVVAQLRVTLREGWKQSIRVGIPLIPTLVFTLVPMVLTAWPRGTDNFWLTADLR